MTDVHRVEEWGRAGEAAVAARRLRDGGMTFKEIGEAMGVSTSQAHSLVEDARLECRVKAERMARGPSHPRPSGKEEALELLRRLRSDFSLFEGQALDHLEADGLVGERAAFEEATGHLEDLIRAGRGRRKDMEAVLVEATQSFHSVLGATAAACEEFARWIGTRRSAETFALDALALGRMISPRTEVELPPWRDEATLDPVGARPRRMDKAERMERDQEIFLAHVHGERQRDIAARFGIGERQVRNIIAGRKGTASHSRAEAARLREALAERTSAFIGCLDSSPSPSLPRARWDVILMLRALAELKGAEAPDELPAGPLVVSRAGLTGEATGTLNAAIRRRLEEAGVPVEVIDDVTELVVENVLSDADPEVSTA
jgi:DNA-directed RNA polymerase specialized sigma24 family protein